MKKPIGVTTYIISKECDAGILFINLSSIISLLYFNIFVLFLSLVDQYELEIEIIAPYIEDLNDAPL